MRQETMERIQREKIIAILRGLGRMHCGEVAEALYAGGIRLLEIAFDQTSEETIYKTTEVIRAVSRQLDGRVLVGAGTVLTPEQVELAAAAGAHFIISPDVNKAVIRRTREMELVSIPGVMTPTEMMAAHYAGADIIKVFPAGELGSAYIKAIRAPLSHLRLMAVGGIHEQNIREFLAAGVMGVGVGGNLVNRTWIEAGAYEKITETAQALVDSVRTAN